MTDSDASLPIPRDEVIAYHQLTKHMPGQYAESPGYMDWANQPDPFRSYPGSRQTDLFFSTSQSGPSYLDVWNRKVPARSISLSSLSQFFYYSMAISAWKQIEGSPAWSLRVNPSSGNLHPTECYLITGPVAGLDDNVAVYHYQPYCHALETCAVLPDRLWSASEIPESGFLIGLSSIHWRESWKYGVRAYRYCQLDVGHALGAIAFASACLGWDLHLLSFKQHALTALLGLDHQSGPEMEVADCLLWITVNNNSLPDSRKIAAMLEEVQQCKFHKKINSLSHEHQEWRAINNVHRVVCSDDPGPFLDTPPGNIQRRSGPLPGNCWSLIRRRRSAVAMDGVTSMDSREFYSMMESVSFLPSNLDLFNGTRWVNLILFIHRVEGLESGLYILIRNNSVDDLRVALNKDFNWTRPKGCRKDLNLYLLAQGDAKSIAKSVCCFQDIAADGCFSLGMLADFVGPLLQWGAGIYPKLYWECGLIGQILYLEAEAIGLSGTGIGCFHDDQFHDLIALQDMRYQCLYHFTIGGSLTDDRIVNLQSYHHIVGREIMS